MAYLIIGMIVGAIVTTGIVAALAQSKLVEERDRANHAIRMANWYKDKCIELQNTKSGRMGMVYYDEQTK